MPINKHCCLLDVTLRDGGYVNSHAFTFSQGYQMVRKLLDAGIDFIEIGYFRRHKKYVDCYGSGVCDVSYLNHLQTIGASNLVVMVRPHDTTPEDYIDLKNKGIKLVRLASPIGYDYLQLIDHITAIQELGIAVSVNCTRSSIREIKEIVKLMEFSIDQCADYFYIADTNGAFYPYEVQELCQQLKNSQITLGYHAHNNIDMAFANAIAAFNSGVKMIDSSVSGLGKCAGNLDTILIALYLNMNCDFNIKIDRLLSITKNEIFTWLRTDILKDYLFKFTGMMNLTSDDKDVVNLQANLKKGIVDEDFLIKILNIKKSKKGENSLRLRSNLSKFASQQ